MLQIKTAILNRTFTTRLATFAGLLGISIIAPFFHYQPLTGSIINATLFLGAVLLPIEYALMLGLLPSLMAISIGTLPIALSPMLPFVMASNAILIICFASLRHKSIILAILSASIFKFLFLFSTSFIVFNLIANQPIAQKTAEMMTWPQLITALFGGLIALLALRAKRCYN